MSFFSKFLLLGLTIISYSDCFMLQPYKLIKPSKLSRSNTPLYLSNKNKNSSNYLKLNDDDGSSFNNKNLFFNLSEYNFKLQQFLNLSENGILKNFIADRTGSIKTGHPRTGSGRRRAVFRRRPPPWCRPRTRA